MVIGGWELVLVLAVLLFVILVVAAVVLLVRGLNR